ncbi:putative quinol monooxygenase [Patulibacter sp. S7RM1-6]
MSVLSHFDLRFVPERLPDGLALLDRILVDTRASSGCHRVVVAQDEADPAHVLVTAEWSSAARHDAYLAWRAGPGAVPELGELLASEPGGRRYEIASQR